MASDATIIRDLLRNLRDDCGHHDAPETREECEAALAALDRLEAERDAAVRTVLLDLWRRVDGDQDGDPPGNAALADGLVNLCRQKDEDYGALMGDLAEASDEIDRLEALASQQAADLRAIWTSCTGIVCTAAGGPDADNIPRRVAELRALALEPMTGPPDGDQGYAVVRPIVDGDELDPECVEWWREGSGDLFYSGPNGTCDPDDEPCRWLARVPVAALEAP